LKVLEQNIIIGLPAQLNLEKEDTFSVFKVLVHLITLNIIFTFLDRMQDE